MIFEKRCKKLSFALITLFTLTSIFNNTMHAAHAAPYPSYVAPAIPWWDDTPVILNAWGRPVPNYTNPAYTVDHVIDRYGLAELDRRMNPNNIPGFNRAMALRWVEAALANLAHNPACVVPGYYRQGGAHGPVRDNYYVPIYPARIDPATGNWVYYAEATSFLSLSELIPGTGAYLCRTLLAIYMLEHNLHANLVAPPAGRPATPFPVLGKLYGLRDVVPPPPGPTPPLAPHQRAGVSFP